MLLFTFIENCFKHGSSCDPGNPFIKIDLSVDENKIEFFAENSKPSIENGAVKSKGCGIGLINVKKRMELICGDNYNLKIQDLENTFLVFLIISK